jgi:hypothetical protein
MNPIGLSYHAYGRPSDHGGFRQLLEAAAPEVNLDMPARLAGAFTPAKAPASPGLKAQGPRGVDLDQAVLVYLGPEYGPPLLMLSRPQQGLSRAGRLMEFIVAQAGDDAEWSRRPLRMVSAFAPRPSSEEVVRASEVFGDRAAAAAESRPLAELLSRGKNEDATLRRLLCGAISAMARYGSAAHVAILIGEESAHLAVPLAMAMDEVLPARKKARGFAVAAFPVAACQGSLWLQLDWTVAPAERKLRPVGDVQGLHVCDLRTGQGADPAIAAQVDRLLECGPRAMEALAEWVESRVGGAIWSLGEEFWRTVGLRARIECGGGVAGEEFVAAVAQGAARSLGVDHFVRLWNAMGQGPSGADVRRRVVEVLASQVQQCPPLLGWLLRAEVVSDSEMAGAVEPEVRRAFAESNHRTGCDLPVSGPQ